MLPKMPMVHYELTLPGTDRVIKYRQWVVAEYRTLLQAKELNDDKLFINTVKNVIKDCIITDIDIDKLPVYSVDYIFLQIRGKSMGEILDAEYHCAGNKEVDGETVPCTAVLPIQLNIADAEVKFPEDYERACVIEISDTVGFKLQSPSFSKFRTATITDEKSIFDFANEYIFSCIHSVYDGNKVLLPGVDFWQEEFDEWLKTFPVAIIDKLDSFIKNQPYIALDLSFTCPRCGTKATIEIKGLDDFFA